MSDQLTLEQISELSRAAVSLGALPVDCTCGKETEPLPWFHSIGCRFRTEGVRTLNAGNGNAPHG